MATNSSPISAPATPALAAKKSQMPSGTIWRFSQPDNPVGAGGAGRVKLLAVHRLFPITPPPRS
jgi:hypothetical protein